MWRKPFPLCQNGRRLLDTFGILGTEKPACPGQVSSQEKCVHEGIETDEEFVCQKCGLVLGQVYNRDLHWLEYAVKAREVTDIDRLNAVDQTLADFLDRVSWYD